MKASIVDGWPKGNEIKILIEGTDAAQVNALRRAIMADVPKMAISKVMFTLGVNQTTTVEKSSNRLTHFLTKLLHTDWQ